MLPDEALFGDEATYAACQDEPRRLRAAGAEVAGTLSKSVFALAIEPLTMALTVTGRKAYDVMLWIAQRNPSASDGGYSSPVSTILKGYGLLLPTAQF